MSALWCHKFRLTATVQIKHGKFKSRVIGRECNTDLGRVQKPFLVAAMEDSSQTMIWVVLNVVSHLQEYRRKSKIFKRRLEEEIIPLVRLMLVRLVLVVQFYCLWTKIKLVGDAPQRGKCCHSFPKWEKGTLEIQFLLSENDHYLNRYFFPSNKREEMVSMSPDTRSYLKYSFPFSINKIS